MSALHASSLAIYSKALGSNHLKASAFQLCSRRTPDGGARNGHSLSPVKPTAKQGSQLAHEPTKPAAEQRAPEERWFSGYGAINLVLRIRPEQTRYVSLELRPKDGAPASSAAAGSLGMWHAVACTRTPNQICRHD